MAGSEQMIGHYRLGARLGQGGMGEVWRATDTRLNRQVAIKLLPPAFAGDPLRLARVEREAKVLAALNHPGIAAIYGLEDSGGQRALVMELVEGETLAEKISVAALAGAAIPAEEALEIARQIAEALEYAHERGIVHRDLKPANVMITPEGTAKVLDFGLAKALLPDESSAGVLNSPTLSVAATQAGVILGTAAYMSPEQAKAKPVDRRADIWAFGCVLYELLTGRRPFAGDSVTELLAAVIMQEPDWSALPARTPAALEKLLRRCLAKDPKQRLRDIGDARLAIEELQHGKAVTAPAGAEVTAVGVAPDGRSRRILPWALAGLLAVALIATAAAWKLAAGAPQPSMHFSAVTNFAGVQADPALSPDGRSVAFVSNRDGHFNIYVGLVHGGNLVQITHDDNVESGPRWSPDGATLAYSRLNHSGLWDVWEAPALGGTPRRVILNAFDPDWSPDGHTLIYQNLGDGALWISGASGEEVHRAITPARGMADFEPRFSPDGREVAFSIRSNGGGPYGELGVADLDSGKTRQLTHDNALSISPAWSAGGRFLYFASSRGGTLNIWKIGADGRGLRQITAGEGDDVSVDVSRDGTRIVFATLRQKIGLAQLDLQSKPGQPEIMPLASDSARNQFGPAYSPDGKHLAYFTNLKGAENEAIWAADADGSNPAPLAQDDRVNIFPAWTPDSNSLVYLSSGPSGSEEYRSVSLSGGAPRTLLVHLGPGIPEVGSDGRLLFSNAQGQAETFDPRTGRHQILGSVPSAGEFLRWSPDGHSVAYSVIPIRPDDPSAGLWVTDFKTAPRQLYRGLVLNIARGPNDEIYFLEGKPDLSAVVWHVTWTGQHLTRTPWTLPLPYNFNYNETVLDNQFSVSPDGRRLAFQIEPVLEENIGMMEVRKR